MSVELENILSQETFARFKEEAQRRHIVVDELIRDVIESFVGDLDDDTDTPDEQVLQNLGEALDDMKAGRVRPAREVMAELRRKYGDE